VCYSNECTKHEANIYFIRTENVKAPEEIDCAGSGVDFEDLQIQNLQNEIQTLQNLQEIQKLQNLTSGVSMENLSVMDMESLQFLQLRAANDAALIGNSYSLVEDYEHKKLMATKGKKLFSYVKGLE
jgi:hypothetical protein